MFVLSDPPICSKSWNPQLVDLCTTWLLAPEILLDLRPNNAFNL